MAARHRAFPWDRSPLGTPEHWPAALRTLVPIMLASNQPMFIAWGPQRTLLFNDPYAEILGIKHSQALGRDFLEVWSEIRGDLQPIVEAAYRGEPVQMNDILLWMEHRGRREETHFSFFYAPVRGDGGQVAGFLCACTEITGQVMAERELARSEARYRGVLANMDEAFTLFDKDFTILMVNDEAVRLVGLPREELIGRNHWQRFPGTHDSPQGEMYRRVLADRQPASMEHTYAFPDGRKVWFEVSAFPVDEGLAVLFRDVTAPRELVAQARHDAERVQLALDVTQLGTWHWDLATGRVSADDRCRRMCGLDADMPFFGIEDIRARIHPDDWPQVEQSLLRAIDPTGGAPYSQEFRWVHHDGRIVWTTSKAIVMFDTGADGQRRATSVMGSVLDHTERMQMLDSLQQADRRKDEFLAMLAHELRNPLAPIATAAQLLKRAGGDPRQAGRAGEVIERQVSHLARLVDDLLDVSRVNRGLVELDRVPVDLREVLAAAAEQSATLLQGRLHTLRRFIDPDPVKVEGDFHRLVQVVANVLNNAAKYTPPGGRIDVHLQGRGNRVVLQVRDDGAGIAPELLPRVFDLFTQAERTPDRSQGGLGIGLALVRSIVHLHGGEVTAESSGIGQGSTFTVSLPRLQAARVAAHPPEAPAGATPPPRSILVVDDNVDAASTLGELLDLLGHSVATAGDARTALRMADTSGPWDAVVLDIGLPDMTGYELARQLRARPAARQSVFVAVTGYGQAQDRELSREAGFHHHLVKPVDVSRLVDVICLGVGRPAA